MSAPVLPLNETLPDSAIRSILAVAGRAPSVHNTQPWRFRLTDTAIELLADRSRQLPAADPDGRELVLSCGAALYNLRLALRSHGRDPVVHLRPDARDRDLLARVEIGSARPSTAGERMRYAAINRRHTHRYAFEPVPVARRLLVELQQIAEHEGAELRLVEHPGHRRAVTDIALAADRLQRGDHAQRREIAQWTPAPGADRRDGVPTRAYPSSAPLRPGELPWRDFALGRGWGLGPDPEEHAGAGEVSVLITDQDTPAAWLIAGQALQAVLLQAATEWCFAQIASQPTEVASRRWQLRDELGVEGFPQLVMRFGYAHTSNTTPRRRLDEYVEGGPKSLGGRTADSADDATDALS